jgi:tetratricopeptide (TPR) repeat protein
VFRHIVLFAALGICAKAQESRGFSSIKGAVLSDESLAGNHLIVELAESTTGNKLGRSFVGSDGSFEFRDVPAGTYTLVLGTSPADIILQQIVNINSVGDRIEIPLPERENKPKGVTGKVSVQDLQHPLSAKSLKIFASAQKAAEAGDYLKQIGILRSVLKDPSAAPYAHMNIGTAYIRAKEPELAILELKEAVEMLPEDAVAHTNYAYALLLTNDLDGAERESRRALQIDRSNSKARWVLGTILFKKGTHTEEALEDLRFASRELPTAKVMLAQFYERHGQKDDAVRELREFLPQASGDEKVRVEQWISNLAVK